MITMLSQSCSAALGGCHADSSTAESIIRLALSGVAEKGEILRGHHTNETISLYARLRFEIPRDGANQTVDGKFFRHD